MNFVTITFGEFPTPQQSSNEFGSALAAPKFSGIFNYLAILLFN